MRSLSGASVALVVTAALSAVSVAGCAKVGELRARKSLKGANQAYQAQDYRKAAQLYEDVVAADPDVEDGIAYFYLGNSYDNQWKPSKKGDPANDELLSKAAANYQKGAEALVKSQKPEYKKTGKLSLQYLVATYGTDKLNDPGKAEPIVQRMIQLDPTDTGNYYVLAKIYEDAGAYDAAENVLLRARDTNPNDTSVYTYLAGYYNRQGEFDKTIGALEQDAAKEPNNPEAFQRIAGFYWDEEYRDFRLNDKQKRDFVQRGIQAADHALKLKPDYVEAMVFKGLLLREKAKAEKDPKAFQALMKEATELHDKAEAMRKKKAAGTGE